MNINRNRKNNGHFGFILAIFLIAVVAILIIQQPGFISGINLNSQISVSDTDKGTDAEPTQPVEVIDIAVSYSDVNSDVWVSAGATVNEPGKIISLSCAVENELGEIVYLNTVPYNEGKWEIVNQQGDCTLSITALSAAGTSETWQQPISFSPSEFIWPVEPEYQMLLHDHYQVSSGSKTVGGYSHNNGIRREKHYVYGNKRNHYGLDITADPGSEVVAAAAGKVLGIYKDTDATGSTGYGTYIIIRHAEKHNGMAVYTLYAHLSEVTVSAGQTVEQGQQVALSGNTGGSRIPHLHLEFRLGSNDKNATIDPLEILPARDFSLRKSALSTDDGFLSSSVNLHADMLSNGWEYKIYGRMLKKITRSGKEISAGTEVEIISRSGSDIKCSYDGITFTCAASAMEYTYDVQ